MVEFIINMLKSPINKKELLFDTTIKGIALIISGLILPAILIVVVRFTGYSEVVEEIAKAIIILFLISNLKTYRLEIIFAILFGFLFGLSENIFYFNQILQSGDINTFWQRFVWTIPMHIFTVLIMTLTATGRKWFLFFGILAAIIIHLIFNVVIVPSLI